MRLPAAERDAALAESQVVSRVLADNPLWRYLPHEGERQWKLEHDVPLDGDEQRGQRAFHEIGTPYGAFVAGNRSGKTHAGVADDLIQILPVEFVPPWLLPYKRTGFEDEVYLRVIGVDLPQWLAKVMLPKLRLLVPRQALWKGDFDKAYNDRERKLRFARGDWIDFLTHDMDIDAFAGADLDRAHFDEEPPGERGRQQYEETLGRLVDRDGEVRWTLTPLFGLTFVYDELTDENGDPREDDECVVVRGDIDHNPHLSSAGRDRFLKRFSKDPLKMAARKSGRWVHFEGLIYPEFSDARHVVPERDLPRAQGGRMLVVPYAAIDPGINEDHKMALLFGFLDDNDVLEIFHSLKFADGTVKDLASHFHATCSTLEFRPRWTVIDPSARNRNPQTGRSMQWALQQHKINTLPGQNAREAGFNAVRERLRATAPDGRPRLVVQAQCEDLIDELRNYRWKKTRGRSDDAPKAQPVKKNDDLVDALRYLVMSMPSAPKPELDEPEESSLAARAFRERVKRMKGGRRNGRIGGVV
jgi:hypothetical protein